MLKDPKAQALSENFAPQWLQIRGLKTFAPDPKMFPTFDEPLRAGDVQGNGAVTSSTLSRKTVAFWNLSIPTILS